MGMNPDTNRFEELYAAEQIAALEAAEREMGPERQARMLAELQRRIAEPGQLVRPNGEPVPAHWTVLAVGELVAIKTHTFRVVHIGESYLLLEPVEPVLVGKAEIP